MKSRRLFILIFTILFFYGYENRIAAENLPEPATTLQPEQESEKFIIETAQALKRNKQYDSAIKWYLSLIKKGGGREEIWMAKYSIGECYELKNDWANALYWYLEAYQVSPKRTIVLKKIANYYRLHAQNNNAHMFAKHGLSIQNPDITSKYDIPSISNYELDIEVSISAYYTDFKSDGYTSINKLILNRLAPWYVKSQAYKNLLFYIKKLKTDHVESIICELPLILETSDERYHPMNPSIQKTHDGYKLICRSVNYTQVGAKVFNTIDPEGYYRTRNFLLTYDKDFTLLTQQEIIENLPREKHRSLNIQGFEDCRIFQMGNSSWFTCTTTDTSPYVSHQISLCKLDNDQKNPEVQVDELIPLKGPDPYRIEKNWLPVFINNSLHIIYSYDPFIILQPNIKTGLTNLVLEYKPSLDFSNFRGSAAPIEFEDGYLMLVHEVVHHDQGERTYTHRFVYLNNLFNIEKLSDPFIFLHQGIEFCCSMTINHAKTQLILPIGIEDNQAYLCFIDLQTINSSLKSVQEFQ